MDFVGIIDLRVNLIHRNDLTVSVFFKKKLDFMIDDDFRIQAWYSVIWK